MKKIVLILIFSLFIISFNGADYKFFKLNNESIAYQELVSNSKNTVLFLWTSWCYFCIRELKKINKDPLADEEIKFYYVNLGEQKKTVEDIANTMGLKDYIKENIILDKEAALADKFSIIGIPAYIFLKNGELTYKSFFINKDLVKKIFEDE